MNNQEWFEFYRWSEEASDEELAERKQAIVAALETMLREWETRADAKRMLRIIEEEQVSRLCLKRRT